VLNHVSQGLNNRVILEKASLEMETPQENWQ